MVIIATTKTVTYTNVFCSSNGKEYYVGDDGQLVRSEWVG